MPKPESNVKGKKAVTYVQVTLRRSLIGRHPKHKAVLQGMGLTRINKSVVLPDNPATRGMVEKVSQFIEVQEVKKK